MNCILFSQDVVEPSTATLNLLVHFALFIFLPVFTLLWKDRKGWSKAIRRSM